MLTITHRCLCKILSAFFTHSIHETKCVDAECFHKHCVRHVRNSGVVIHDTGIVYGDIQFSECLHCFFTMFTAVAGSRHHLHARLSRQVVRCIPRSGLSDALRGEQPPRPWHLHGRTVLLWHGRYLQMHLLRYRLFHLSHNVLLSQQKTLFTTMAGESLQPTVSSAPSGMSARTVAKPMFLSTV